MQDIFFLKRQGLSQDLELRGAKVKKKKIETLNKHSINKPSTKKNTQNYYFLRYDNAIIYEGKNTILVPTFWSYN